MKIKAQLILAFFLGTVLIGNAQDEKNGKIKIEISREINGEKRTFKGEYENMEQMRSDPNYQEFAGEDGGVSFWFDQGDDADISINLDQFGQFGKSLQFGFGGSHGLQGLNFFKHLGDSSGQPSAFFHLNDDDSEEHQESIQKLREEMESLLEKLGEDGDSHVLVFSSKKIKVTDVEGDEFGKKGEVDKSNLLELEDLSFSPNPSSDGRFKVKFRVPEENELTLKVLNLEGKEVFSRYFERFGGVYSETVDLSGQKEGMYLLEISQDKKRLTKKIVIN